jgi:hypothetical protein
MTILPAIVLNIYIHDAICQTRGRRETMQTMKNLRNRQFLVQKLHKHLIAAVHVHRSLQTLKLCKAGQLRS